MNESQNYTDDNGTMHVISADATVKNAFSENGNVTVYYVTERITAVGLPMKSDLTSLLH